MPDLVSLESAVNSEIDSEKKQKLEQRYKKKLDDCTIRLKIIKTMFDQLNKIYSAAITKNEKLITRIIGQVISTDGISKVNKYLHTPYGSVTITFSELQNYGRQALLDAFLEYNPYLYKNKGKERPSFLVFASFHIRHALTRTIIREGKNIRLPEGVAQESIRLEKGFKEGKTAQEIAAEIGTDKEEVRKLAKTYHSFWKTYLLTEEMLDQDPEAQERQIMHTPNFTTPEEYIYKENLTEVIKTFLETELSENEQEVLKYRFGFYNGEEMSQDKTFQELNAQGLKHKKVKDGAECEFDRERVRFVESAALAKLRKSLVRNTDLKCLIDS